MLFTPPYRFVEIQTNLSATPSTTIPGTSATGSGTANTKGTWREVFSSVNFDIFLVEITIVNTFLAATNTSALLDVGIGASTAEQVIMSNILAGWAGTSLTPRKLQLPFFIPKGSRIAIRCQGVQTSKVINVVMRLWGGCGRPSLSFVKMVDYGVTSSGNSIGTSHTAGNSGAESSWASVGSTTSERYQGLLLLVQGTMTNTVMSELAYHFEIGYSSTTLGEWYVKTSTSEITNTVPGFPILVNIPSGTQLQVRGECSGTAQAMDVAIYGLV